MYPENVPGSVESRLASQQAEIDSLKFNTTQLEHRVRHMEKLFDTANSPWYMRWWWVVDGWGPWFRLATKRSWRPWH